MRKSVLEYPVNEATFERARYLCELIGSKIASLESLNYHWEHIIYKLENKVSKFGHTNVK